MKALVTGATGYIGSHLCRHLAQHGWNVSALTRPSSNLAHLPEGIATHQAAPDDLGDMVAAVKNAKPDAVFHLASHIAYQHGGARSEALVNDNVLYGARLLEAVMASSCRRFINTGSYWEYDETGAYNPNTLYAASKHAFQDILHWYGTHTDLKAATLVLFDVYGPADWRGKILSRFLAQMDNPQAPLALTEGLQELDMVHVEDVAEAFRHAVDILPGGAPPVWGIATGIRATLREVAEHLSKLAGKKLAVDWGAQPYPPQQIMKPVKNLPPLPGWQAKTALNAGLSSLLKTEKSAS